MLRSQINKISSSHKELMQIPGVGKSIAQDLINIGINSINDLKGLDPQEMYDKSNELAGVRQDRCLLYVFRLAVYYADTEPAERKPDKLLWWNWKYN
ncbi:MAG: pathogenicity locus [Candidatus Kapabacteria bacterium]|nr:pathogenicity locus [Candidatus Kapabacteria bacterium]